jgi:phosphoribosyl-AMP cyclohydrolase / phosphoribosyl-ATP pyrophosphohydrolase
MTRLDLDAVRYDDHGLVPVVVQDFQSGTVLMVAYMNEESLRKTVKTGETHFWSRSRQTLWHKGETSGNTQKIRRLCLDCDGDAILVQVDQRGNACHTGEYSCFLNPVYEHEPGTKGFGEVMGGLSRRIAERKVERPENSYTTELFQSGVDKILKKVGEEAAETIIAAKNHDRKEIVWEVSDLLYHLLVLLANEDVSLAEVSAELRQRAGKRPRLMKE